VDNTIRLLKNITGMWLLQECRRVWNRRGKDWDWDDLGGLASAARPLVSFIYPDAPEFAAPENMPEAIREFCKRTGQTVPEDEGAVLRCVLDSLALRFRQVLAECEELAGRRIETIHIVGGGTRNRQLCQLTSDACDRPVVAGPIEATAIGNAMQQAVSAGDISTIAEAREVIRRSFPMDRYKPHKTGAWDDAFEKFVKVT
jgi:rhamnulokinase